MAITTKWDKPRNLLEDMIKDVRELERAWPSIADRDLRPYWHREIDRVAKSLDLLRQAAVASQEMELVYEQRERERWATDRN